MGIYENKIVDVQLWISTSLWISMDIYTQGQTAAIIISFSLKIIYGTGAINSNTQKNSFFSSNGHRYNPNPSHHFSDPKFQQQ